MRFLPCGVPLMLEAWTCWENERRIKMRLMAGKVEKARAMDAIGDGKELQSAETTTLNV